MQDIWSTTPVKVSFNPKGVAAHRLRTTALQACLQPNLMEVFFSIGVPTSQMSIACVKLT